MKWIALIWNWLDGLWKPTPARTGSKGEKLTAFEISFLPHCPDCGDQLMEGPHGGLSINVYCINDACGSRFNDMGVFGIERISAARPKKQEPRPARPYR